VLREQMRAIKRELDGDDNDELAGLKKRLDGAVDSMHGCAQAFYAIPPAPPSRRDR